MLARPDLAAKVSDIDHADADPRGRHRAGGRGADPRPPRAQGRAAQRGQARDAVGAALARSTRTPPPRCAARPMRRRRRSPRWPRHSARRAPRTPPRRAGGAGTRRGGLPAGRRARTPTRRPPAPCARPLRRSASRRRGRHLGRAHLRRRARARRPWQALLAVAPRAAAWRTRPESGLIGVPASTNGRGLREVGCLPDIGPGLADALGGPVRAGDLRGEAARRCCSFRPTRFAPIRTRRPGSARSTPPPA